MKITFLGTGSSIPTPKTSGKPFRSYSSTLIETNNSFLLFDIGPGTILKLLGSGVDILKKPTHLFISHYHLDHCQDITALVKARGLNYSYTEDIEKLNIYGPTGLKHLLTQLFSGVEKWNYMVNKWNSFDLINLHETMDGPVVVNENFKVSCMPIEHYGGIVYRLDAEDKSVIYSGDMGYDENLSALGKNADLAIVECSYPDEKSLKGLHLSPESVAKLVSLGNFKQTVLTHMYPSCEGREDEMKKYIEENSNTNVTVADDFLTIKI